ncbi:6,7-dimethyl-8-ribityllumazine synthase [Lipomyces oligophaga]|uniref:6,7-dimethyl-8-ribityllumazine synthase n=1 Tax=Lipomyces oligophaga TaxID=45792 RepID=UPI0034CFB0AE
MESIKGRGTIDEKILGESLRIGIVRTRWNTKVIDALIEGCLKRLGEFGVLEENIVLQTVPGSYELPFAVSRMYAASKIQASSAGAGSNVIDLLSAEPGDNAAAEPAATTQKAFDAIIAIGCLIKGETMHFEYICDATSTALMNLQFSLGIPVIFGVLACLSDEQALARAGLTANGHNHGIDWAEAAVEMGIRNKAWNNGTF